MLAPHHHGAIHFLYWYNEKVRNDRRWSGLTQNDVEIRENRASKVSVNGALF